MRSGRALFNYNLRHRIASCGLLGGSCASLPLPFIVLFTFKALNDQWSCCRHRAQMSEAVKVPNYKQVSVRWERDDRAFLLHSFHSSANWIILATTGRYSHICKYPLGIALLPSPYHQRLDPVCVLLAKSDLLLPSDRGTLANSAFQDGVVPACQLSPHRHARP